MKDFSSIALSNSEENVNATRPTGAETDFQLFFFSKI